MTYETKQELKTRKNKEALLTAAIEITREYGPDKLTMKNICAQAGLSNGSFYHLFKSKEELISYYIRYSFEQYVSHMPDPHKHSAIENCLNLYDAYLDCCMEVGPEFMSLFYSPTNQVLNWQERAPEDAILLDSIGRFIDEGKESGEFRGDVNTEEAMSYVAAAVTGPLFYWCVIGESYDVRSAVHTLMTLYLESLKP